MDYVDFANERLLPHKLSDYGPGLAVADVNGDGLDDFFIGGTGDYTGKFFLQQHDGKFQMKNLVRWPLAIFVYSADSAPTAYQKRNKENDKLVRARPNFHFS